MDAVSSLVLWRELEVKSLVDWKEKANGSRVLLFFLVIGFGLAIDERLVSSLSANVASVLIEAKILKLVSSVFVCREVLFGVSNIALCACIGPFIERRRGTYHLAALVVVVSLMSEMLTLSFFLSSYYFTFDTYYLDTNVCGFVAMTGGFGTALAEEMPDAMLFDASSLSVKHLPLMLSAMAATAQCMGLWVAEMCLVYCGAYTAWLYLRYYADCDGTKGNASESFALSSFFPSPVRPVIDVVGNGVYAICRNVGCCQIGEGKGNGSALKVRTEMSPLLDESSPMDPRTQQQREEAKRLIETRLAELQKEIDQRAVRVAVTDTALVSSKA